MKQKLLISFYLLLSTCYCTDAQQLTARIDSVYVNPYDDCSFLLKITIDNRDTQTIFIRKSQLLASHFSKLIRAKLKGDDYIIVENIPDAIEKDICLFPFVNQIYYTDTGHLVSQYDSLMLLANNKLPTVTLKENIYYSISPSTKFSILIPCEIDNIDMIHLNNHLSDVQKKKLGDVAVNMVLHLYTDQGEKKADLLIEDTGKFKQHLIH